MTVSRALLGKILVSCSGTGEIVAGRIVETEGYMGEDPAAHCFRGKTKRCAPMFESPGRAYVYFIYGMYEMLNFVTEREGVPGAVLIRGTEPVLGMDLIRKRRGRIPEKDWMNGPGRLSRAFGIKVDHNRESLSGPRLYVLDDGMLAKEVFCSPRVGIRQGQDLKWRYYIGTSRCVSKVKENKMGKKWSQDHEKSA